MTASNAWPKFHYEKERNCRSQIRWQHRLNRERPICTERNESLLESANGSMATVAIRLEKNLCLREKRRIHLTPTGLLMEGVYTHNQTVMSVVDLSLLVRAGRLVLVIEAISCLPHKWGLIIECCFYVGLSCLFRRLEHSVKRSHSGDFPLVLGEGPL